MSLLNPYAILGAFLMALAAFFAGSHVGKKFEREVWQKKEIALLTARAVERDAEARDRDRLLKFHQATARKASADYEKSLEDLRTAYAADVAAVKRAGGLRIPKRTCPSPAGPEAPGASGPDEAGPATEELPERIEDRLFKLTERADALAEQLRSLQNWVKASGFYGEPGS